MPAHVPTHPCPNCLGRGAITGIACGPHGGEVRTASCALCHGTGRVDADRLAKVEDGRRMRDARRARGISQRDRARELGMDVIEYSRLENGRD